MSWVNTDWWIDSISNTRIRVKKDYGYVTIVGLENGVERELGIAMEWDWFVRPEKPKTKAEIAEEILTGLDDVIYTWGIKYGPLQELKDLIAAYRAADA